MATKITCDVCGKEGAGRVTFNLARSEPLKMPDTQPWKFDQDLCQEHFDKAIKSVTELFRKAMAD
jgi:hypothetical protein